MPGSEKFQPEFPSLLCLFYSCFTSLALKSFFPRLLLLPLPARKVLKVCSEHYNFFMWISLCKWRVGGGGSNWTRRWKALARKRKVHALIKKCEKNLFISSFIMVAKLVGRQIMNGTFSINYFTGSQDLPSPLITRSIYPKGKIINKERSEVLL